MISAEVFDEYWDSIRKLAEDSPVSAGEVNDLGRVETPFSSTIELSFTQDELNDILENGRYIIFNFRLSTRPENERVGLYTDYRVKAKLVGDFDYKLSN